MRKLASWLMILLSMAVPLVAVVVGVAYAADLCIGIGRPNGTGDVGAVIVVKDVGGGAQGKGMSNELAKPNKCREFSGFTSDDNLGVTFVNIRSFPAGLVGTISMCTSSDASQITVISNFLGRSVQSVIQLPIPTTIQPPASNGLSNSIDSLGGVNLGFNPPQIALDVPTTAAVCSPPSVPAS